MSEDSPEAISNIEAAQPPPPAIWWFVCGGLVTVVSAFLRFYDLGLKPLHHDEGVNGFFLTTLFKDGVYHYDPANYHGPTLYYIALVFADIFGLKTVPVRASVAIFGVLTVILVLFLRRYLGDIGSLAAAVFLALSPGMVYISRYFIHEIFFLFCSLAVVAAVVFFVEKRRAGPFAIGWMSLILAVCFMPSGLTLASYLGGDNLPLVWILRVGFIVIEAMLIVMVVRMLLSWDGGRPVYMLLAAASVALLFATKETAFITLGTMMIACFATWLWRSFALTESFRALPLRYLVVGAHIVALFAAVISWRQVYDSIQWYNEYFIGEGHPQEYFVYYALMVLAAVVLAAWGWFIVNALRSNDSSLTEPVDLTWANFREGLGRQNDLLLIAVAAATVFVFLIVLFFSSFFTYKEGVQRAFEAYALWTSTGTKDHTQNGYLAYVKWGIKVETPILLLSSLGALIALIKAKHRFGLFVSLWAFGLFAAYTIIPYKTPWLALSFYLPMCLAAGYGINELAGTKNAVSKAFAGALLVIAIAVQGYQAYDLSFVRYDDEDMGYVYAHTKRGFLDMIKEIDHYAQKSSAGKNATIEIVSPDYWPMPWYTNEYPNAHYNGQLVDASTAEMIVAKKPDQDGDVIKRYSAHYKFVGVYPLRPGVDLTLLVRRDLADPDAQDTYKLLEYQSP